MTINLGQLLQAVDSLDRAAAHAPLTRNDHVVTQQCAALLRQALPELWAAKKVVPTETVAPLPGE